MALAATPSSAQTHFNIPLEWEISSPFPLGDFTVWTALGSQISQSPNKAVSFSSLLITSGNSYFSDDEGKLTWAAGSAQALVTYDGILISTPSTPITSIYDTEAQFSIFPNFVNGFITGSGSATFTGKYNASTHVFRGILKGTITTFVVGQ